MRFLKQKIAVSSVATMNGGRIAQTGNSGMSGEDVGVGVVYVAGDVHPQHAILLPPAADVGLGLQ